MFVHPRLTSSSRRNRFLSDYQPIENEYNGDYASLFLRECDACHNYLARGRAGTLRLPGYETNAAGHVFVQRGEVFCRVRSCEHRSVPLSSTTNLRAHLLRHGLQCQDTLTGRISQAKKTEAIQWYAAGFGADEENDDE